MAKVVFGPIVSDVRKKEGGTVFTKGRSGAFIRRKVSPTQPRTSAQMNVRANFTALAKLWSDASMATYRAGWIGLAASYPKKDKFGASHTLTGLQLFVRLNRARETCGQVPLLIPPATLSVGYPGVIVVTPSGGPPITSLKMNEATFMSGTENTLVYATAGQSPGRASAGAKFRLINTYGPGGGNDFEMYGDYVAKFGTPIIGRQIFFRAVFTEITTGAQSLPTEASITI